MPIFNTSTGSFQYLEITTSLVMSASSVANFTSASLVTGSFTGRGSGLTQVTASYILVGSNTTASNALTASFLLGSVTSASYSISASNAAYATTASYLVANYSASVPAYQEGVSFYDTASRTLSYYNENSQMTVNLGQESVIRVYNSAADTISNGAAVYLSASFSGSPVACLAIADGTKAKFNVAGVATTTIGASAYGYITVSGKVNGLSINLPTGSMLWLSSTTSGSYQTTSPAFPSEQVFVGTLVASGSGASSILVNLNEHSFGAITSSFALTSSYVNNHKGFINLYVQSAKLPGTSSARIDAGDRMWRLLYDPVSPQSASWQFMVPPDYASGPKVYMKYAVTIAQGAPVSQSTWAFRTSAVGQGTTIQTFVTASTTLTASVSASQAANTMITTSLSLTGTTNITASEMLVFELERLASAALDTVSSDIAVVGLTFEYVTT